jgi:magnesium-protoporphyrin IX monomethyl ester (oxidative) cyclase
MPFAAIERPSLGLTQLKSVLETDHKDNVSIEILYLNHDILQHIGPKLYRFIADTQYGMTSGLGEWFFRQSAFPQLADNSEHYFNRYYPDKNERSSKIQEVIVSKQRSLDRVLDRLIDKHNIFDSDLVGFTSLFAQNNASFALARRLKLRNPQLITAMGGSNCDLPMGHVIAKEVTSIDYVFSGSALITLSDFVEHCLQGDVDKCHTIPGVFSAYNCSDNTSADRRGQDMCINADIQLDYSDFLDSFESLCPGGKLKPALLFETSRGCWRAEHSKCTFCGLNGPDVRYRAKEPEKALTQFESLFAYLPRCSRYVSVDNVMPKTYPEEVFKSLRPPAGVSIQYEVSPALSGREIAILKDAGVRSVQPGIEALNTSTLKLINKGSDVFRNLLLLKNSVIHDIHPKWNLLMGFPGEKETVYEKYNRDIPLLTHLPPPSAVYRVRYDRYSHYYDDQDSYNLNLEPYDFYELGFPFEKELISKIAIWFQDRNAGIEDTKRVDQWINKIRQKVDWWKNLWQDKCNGDMPRLFMQTSGEHSIVHDSRSGTTEEYVITDTAQKVLKLLETPQQIEQLYCQVHAVSCGHIKEQINWLSTIGLIFREDDRVFSLVLSKTATD